MKDGIRLSLDITPKVTFQRYDPQPAIEGVFYQPLKKHRAVEGWFMEHLRLTAGKVEGWPVPFEVRQLSWSRAVPNRINAFHIHPKVAQDELWSVLDGTLMVWLVDCRDGSPTEGTKRRHVLSGEEPALLLIPSGVAHGYKAGREGALLAYAMNSQFNLMDPNEGRLPWDHFGRDLWEDDRG
jgi:dTDP-4-dehydrorhamnose 3,5-epimerase